MGAIKPCAGSSVISKTVLCLWKARDVRRIRSVSVFIDAPLIPSQRASRSFNNAIWLVMNDVILGRVAGAVLCDNSEVIGTSLHDWLKVCSRTLTSAVRDDNQRRIIDHFHRLYA
jgi:hypothetical protein